MLMKIAGVMLSAVIFVAPATAGPPSAATAVMYKNPGCECCDGHAAALRSAGIEVRVVPVSDLEAVKSRFGVPAELAGCHTTIIGKHAIEGHVPIAAVQKMLKEKPSIRGIALPGMPAGSPGMSGRKVAPFKVLSFGAKAPELYLTV